MRVQNITTPYLWVGIRKIIHGMQRFGEWEQTSSERRAEVINTIHFLFQRKEFVANPRRKVIITNITRNCKYVGTF